MDLVAEDAIDPADNNSIARKIAGLVMADTLVTAVTSADLVTLLTDRFGDGVVGAGDDLTQQAAILDATSGLPAALGLSVGKLDPNPGLQLTVKDPDGMTRMVEAGIAAISPVGFEGALFNERLPGGRFLKTYAYTDVMDPWQEMFETAYGRLNDPVKPVAPKPVVADPGTGIDVTDDMITAYNEYAVLQGAYERDFAAYERDLAEITEDDFMGKPEAGAPSNTPEGMLVVDAAADDRVDTQTQFWHLARIDIRHLPKPRTRPSDQVTDLTITSALYRPEGTEDPAGPSELSGSFDGVEGKFFCMTDSGLCQIGAVGTAKEPGGRVVGYVDADDKPYNVEYSFQTDDTWKFVATDRTVVVETLRQDGDYLVMGWWLETASVSTGDFKFGRFFAGSDPYGDTAAVVVPPDEEGVARDSATYTGSAVGKYAERDAGTDTARKGLFRATATLTVNFEVVDVDDNIKGTIDEFVDDSGVPRPAWHVVLGESEIAAGAFGATTSGEAQGQDWKGSWNGEFYGQGAVEATVPSSVAGLFNAWFGCNEMGGCAEGEGDDAVVPAEVGFVGVSGVFGADHSGNFVQPVADDEG